MVAAGFIRPSSEIVMPIAPVAGCAAVGAEPRFTRRPSVDRRPGDIERRSVRPLSRYLSQSRWSHPGGRRRAKSLHFRTTHHPGSHSNACSPPPRPGHAL